jgi:hypothetical protein
MNKMKCYAVSVGGFLAVMAGSASAADIDVTSITTILTSVGVAVGLIGLAVLGVKYGAKAYKWISSAG